MASRAFEHVVLFTVATSVREEETDEGQIVLLAWLILSTSKNQVSTNQNLISHSIPGMVLSQILQLLTELYYQQIYQNLHDSAILIDGFSLLKSLLTFQPGGLENLGQNAATL